MRSTGAQRRPAAESGRGTARTGGTAGYSGQTRAGSQSADSRSQRTQARSQGVSGRSQRTSVRGQGSYGRGQGSASRGAGRSSGSIDEARARARARARKRKRIRQRRMILGCFVLLLLLAAVGIFLMVRKNRREEQKQEFLTEGIALVESGKYEEAVAKLNEALQWSGDKMGEFEQEVLLYRAGAEYRLRDFDAALKTYETLQAADSENVEYQRGVALCTLEKGDVNGALAMGVIDGYVYNRMAVDQIRARDFDRALDSIDRGKAAGDPSVMKDLTYNEAVVWENKGDYAKALELFESYVSQYGSDENAQREIDFLKSRVNGAENAGEGGESAGEGSAEGESAGGEGESETPAEGDGNT